VDWFIWRIVVAERFKASLAEIEGAWSLDDLVDAHALLDALEAARPEGDQ